MRKIILFLALLISAMMVFADSSWNGDSVGGDSSATLSTTINLSSSGEGSGDNDKFEIGFSTSAVDALDDEVSAVNGTVSLVIDDETGKASLPGSDTGIKYYIYWKIQSAGAQNISLSWPDNLTAPEGGNLGWTISTQPASSGVQHGKASTGSESAILTRNPSANNEFKFGTAGSQVLTITTDPVTEAAVGNYNGTLTLTITT